MEPGLENFGPGAWIQTSLGSGAWIQISLGLAPGTAAATQLPENVGAAGGRGNHHRPLLVSGQERLYHLWTIRVPECATTDHIYIAPTGVDKVCKVHY